MENQAVGQGVLLGRVIGHYRIAEKIGAGGMGEVFRAYDEHLERDVAIKTLLPGTLGDESARKRFRKEALALSKLNHPNIATIYDFDTQEGVDFLVMEYIAGITLNEKLAKGSLPESEIIALGTQLAEGLAAAHQRGVIHRDLKPGNLRLTRDGRLKILDFGLARLRLPVPPTGPTESLSETQTMAGTLPYMAPEQLLGGEIDARTDIHAVGEVLYEMATGQHPFAQVERSQLIGAILHKPPQPPTSANSKLTPELGRIIVKCLEKAPDNRYQSAKDLAVDLRRMDTLGVTVPPQTARRFLGNGIWKMAAIAIVIVALLVVALLFRLRRTRALTEADTIMLADFVNKTNDPVFDNAPKQALALELSQSPFLDITSDARISSTLKMMGRPEDERMSPALAREVCQRLGSKALLGGLITSFGSRFLVDVEAVACATGDTLAREHGEAKDKEDVLRVLSQASSSIRRKLGESLSTVQKYDVPIEATTPSLEALSTYNLAARLANHEGAEAAIPFLKRAIELDPNFALAYADLSSLYWNLDQSSLALEHATKAYQLRERGTQKERWHSSATYFVTTGQLEKEAEVYELWIASYPRSAAPYISLARNYSDMGQHEKALAAELQAIRLESRFPSVNNYANLINTYSALNRLQDARVTADRALALKLDGEVLRQNMYLLGFLQRDNTFMEQQVAWSAGKPFEESVLMSLQADTEAYFGRLKKARELTRRAVDAAMRADAKGTAASLLVSAALREAELGNFVAARQELNAALKLEASTDVEALAALALARTGELGRAKVMVDKLERDCPTNTLLKFYTLPTIRAVMELQKGNPSQAVVGLEAASPYELGMGALGGCMYPVYVRGQAHLSAHNGAAAAAEFQRMLDHHGIVMNVVTGALSYLQIGRAHAIEHDMAKAKATYEDFFALWKDADPDIPILKQARAEYAKLQ